MKDTTNADLTIKATGYQWKWGYDYLEAKARASASSRRSHAARADRRRQRSRTDGEHYLLEVDKPLVVPVDKKVRIITTANDVIHAWWVPALGVKQDAIPGFVRDTWFRAEQDRRPIAASAPSCAARSTASCRSSCKVVSAGRLHEVGRERRQEMAALADDPNKVWDTGRARRARREGLSRRTAWPATRPTARAHHGAFPRAGRLQGRHGRHAGADCRSC